MTSDIRYIGYPQALHSAQFLFDWEPIRLQILLLNLLQHKITILSENTNSFVLFLLSIALVTWNIVDTELFAINLGPHEAMDTE